MIWFGRVIAIAHDISPSHISIVYARGRPRQTIRIHTVIGLLTNSYIISVVDSLTIVYQLAYQQINSRNKSLNHLPCISAHLIKQLYRDWLAQLVARWIPIPVHGYCLRVE